MQESSFGEAQPFQTRMVNKTSAWKEARKMKVDLYRRAEGEGRFSYLAVPQGRPIPEEAVSIDWEAVDRDIDLERSDTEKTGITFDDGNRQIDEKGYAISRLEHLKNQLKH